MRWLALIVGLLFISAFTILFIALAVTMGPFGGIPYSWNLLFLNAPWVAMLAAGLLLIISAARMFRRAKGSR